MAERTANDPTDPKKQKFLSSLANVAMLAGLVTAYGTLAAIMARFLYPSRPSPRGWMFVSDLGQFANGESRLFTTPTGESVNITRQGAGERAEDFTTLSSVGAHLGCQVDSPSRIRARRLQRMSRRTGGARRDSHDAPRADALPTVPRRANDHRALS